MRKIIGVGVLGISLLMVSCGDKQKQNNARTEEAVMETPMSTQNSSSDYAVGDIVPSDLVCMVNNEFMGTDQLEVDVDGKTYYGCCEMCQNLLPNDPKVRVAVDPVSNNEVDKAVAVIAITGVNGEVSYFESEDTYKQYIGSN